MMRSLYSAVSGLKTHQTRMDVIGNNISNVNTEAFKASSVRFSEIMYQTISSASAGNGATGTGGVNAKQIGLGVSTASTTCSVTSAGASETTGNPFDLRLTDSQTTNFFIVSDGTNTMFTRAGSFYVDGNGYLCMSSTGYTLQGWQVDPTTGEIRKDTVSALQVMSPENQVAAPEATTKAYVPGVLDKNDPNLQADGGYVMNLGFYDDLGYTYTAKFSVVPNYENNGTDIIPGSYHITLTDIVDSDSESILGKVQNMTKEQQIQAIFGGQNANGYDILFDVNEGNFISIGGNVSDELLAAAGYDPSYLSSINAVRAAQAAAAAASSGGGGGSRPTKTDSTGIVGVLGLGRGPISAEYLAELVADGEVIATKQGNNIVVKNAPTTSKPPVINSNPFSKTPSLNNFIKKK